MNTFDTTIVSYVGGNDVPLEAQRCSTVELRNFQGANYCPESILEFCLSIGDC
jgi:hypothetical protein